MRHVVLLGPAVTVALVIVTLLLLVLLLLLMLLHPTTRARTETTVLWAMLLTHRGADGRKRLGTVWCMLGARRRETRLGAKRGQAVVHRIGDVAGRKGSESGLIAWWGDGSRCGHGPTGSCVPRCRRAVFALWCLR